ncbi:MAG: efflux RND transporter permease subunit [Planctomycetota bacterium]
MWQLFFERHQERIARIGWCLLPVVGLLGLSALGTARNDVRDWLPEGYAETQDYRRFQAAFGNDEFIVISWAGCTLDDERVDRLHGLLAPDGGGRGLVDRISTGREVLRRLTAAPLRLSREQAVERLQGTLAGPDGRHTCVMVWLTPEARASVPASLLQLERAIEQAGVPFRDVRWAGAPVLNRALDEASLKAMFKAIILSCLAAVLIAWAALRDVRITILVLVTGFYGATLSLSLLPLTRTPMSSLLITMIPMVYTAAISGAIHLCNYYLESLRSCSPRTAAVRAVRGGWLPLALAAGTTAAGLLTLCLNDLKPVQQFGWFSSIGIGLSWFLVVLWLPAALAGLGRPATEQSESGVAAAVIEDAPLPRLWTFAGKQLVRFSVPVCMACAVTGLWAATGVPRLEITLNLLEEFREGAPVVESGRWLEEKLGALTSLEVLVEVPLDCSLSPLERLLLVRRLEQRLLAHPDIAGALSIAGFAPDPGKGGLGFVQRSELNRRLQRQREQLLTSGFLAVTPAAELWRVNLRLRRAEQLDYNRLSREIRRDADAVVGSGRTSGVRVWSTGIAPLIYRARRSMVDGLMQGLCTDVLLIVAAIIPAMRSGWNGLLLMLTSLFPTLLVLGGLGWFRIPINVGAVLAPCVALGVTVDDSIHFVVWFRRGVRDGLGRGESVLLAWRACVRPIYQSWLLLGLGMLTQAVNDFSSIRHFGLMMTAMLTAGLAGNLILQPALLASPAGEWIAKGFRRGGDEVGAAGPASSAEPSEFPEQPADLP